MIQLQSYRRQRKLYFKGHLGLQNYFITGFVPGIFVVFVLQAAISGLKFDYGQVKRVNTNNNIN